MSGFNGEFSLYSIYDLDTPLFTCTVLDSLPFSAIVTMDGDLFVVMLRSKDVQEKPFTLTITGEAGSIEIPSSLLPAAYAIYVSPYYLSHEASHPVALVEWNAGENGTLTIKNPYSGYPFYSRSTSIPVWSPVLLETTTIYSLSNTGGNLTLVLGTNVHRWGANESFRFYIINDNEFALTASPTPFVICLKNDTLFRIRALSFEGGHLRATVDGVTVDYELSNFGEGWLKVGTGAVAPPEGYAGYYELTNEVSELPIPEGVQTLFVNRLNGTEYREFDLADYPLLQFFAVLGNKTAIGVKAEGHANLRLVNLTNEYGFTRDGSVFRVVDCPQLAAIHLKDVEAKNFTLRGLLWRPSSS